MIENTVQCHDGVTGGRMVLSNYLYKNKMYYVIFNNHNYYHDNTGTADTVTNNIKIINIRAVFTW